MSATASQKLCRTTAFFWYPAPNVLTKSTVRVPNAPKSAPAGAYADGVKIKINAPAADGRANAELVKFLSKFFGVGRGGVKIISGETSRDKLVRIEGAQNCLERLRAGK